MSIDVSAIVMIMYTHFVADFVLQSNNMSINKSKSLKWLAFHSIVYGSVWLVFPLCGLISELVGLNQYSHWREIGLAFAAVNCAAHMLVDFVTSKITSKLWKSGEVHWFFVVVGFDQFVHSCCLVTAYALLMS